MTTGIKIALGIAVAVAIAAGGYYGFMNGKEDAKENVTSETASSTSAGGKKMAFEQFVKQGGTYKCTVKQSVSGVTTEGTIYTDKGYIRGDTSAASAAGPMSVSFIIREGFVYYWGSVMPAGQGIKLAYDATGYKPGDFNQFDQIGDYECDVWTADPSKFIIPTTVTFQLMK